MKLNKMFGIIERCAIDFKNEKLAEVGLSGCNYYYVMSVVRNEGITQDELVKRICVNKSNVARNIKYLEDNGFVIRKTDENDKRINRIYPTQKAIVVFPIIKEVNQEWKSILLKEFSSEETEELDKLLTKLVSNATNHFNKTYIEEDL